MDMGSAWEHPCQGFQISSGEVKGFAGVALYADRFLICCTGNPVKNLYKIPVLKSVLVPCQKLGEAIMVHDELQYLKEITPCNFDHIHGVQ
jgi:hypothetical protein